MAPNYISRRSINENVFISGIFRRFACLAKQHFVTSLSATNPSEQCSAEKLLDSSARGRYRDQKSSGIDGRCRRLRCRIQSESPIAFARLGKLTILPSGRKIQCLFSEWNGNGRLHWS